MEDQDFDTCRRKYGVIHHGGRDLALIQEEVEFDKKTLLAKIYAVDRRGKKYVVLLGYPAVYRLGD